MKNILKYAKELKSISFGGNAVDVFEDYELKIPNEASDVYNKLLVYISKYIYDLKKDEYKWFLYNNENTFYSSIFELLIELKTEEEFREKLRNLIGIVGGLISDLAIEKELGFESKARNLDILISYELTITFSLVKILKEDKTINNFQKLDNAINELEDENEFGYLNNLMKMVVKESLLEIERLENKTEDITNRENETIFFSTNGFNIIIQKVFTDIEEFLSYTDFSFRKFYFDGKVVKTTKGALYDLKNKKLHVSAPFVTISALFRGFEFRDRYNFEFSDVDKKIIFDEFILGERVKKYFRKILLKNKKEECLKFIEEEIKEISENENEHKFLKYTHSLIKQDDENNKEDIFKKVLMKKISLHNKYKEKYREEVEKLIDWSIKLKLITRLRTDEVLSDKLSEERKLITSLRRELKNKVLYYSKLKDYYIDNKLYKLTYWKENIQIHPLGIPRNILEEDEFKFEGKKYSKNELLDIRKKIEMIKIFENESNLHIVGRTKYWENMYKKIGINFTENTSFKQENTTRSNDLLKRLEVNKKINEFSLILNTLMYGKLVKEGIAKSNDLTSMQRFIIGGRIQEKYMEFFFINNIEIVFDLSLNDLIKEDSIEFGVDFYDCLGGELKSSYYFTVLAKEGGLDIDFSIDNPLKNVVWSKLFKSYIKEFKNIVEENIKNNFLININEI